MSPIFQVAKKWSTIAEPRGSEDQSEVNPMSSPFNEIRDGFQLTPKTFHVPSDTSRLDPAAKRKTTICNLFANHRLPIRDVMRILDESYANVVRALIEGGIVHERRNNRQETVDVERRQSLLRSQ
jgi:hypothetical protein